MAGPGPAYSTDMFEPEADLFTRTGTRIHVRPAGEADSAAVATFFAALDPEDLRDRFLAEGDEIDSAWVERMCRPDFPATLSFLAFHQQKLIALAHLSGAGEGRVELALATLPEWKRRGVSWALLGHVVNYAGEKGVRQIASVERGGNRAAITLEHEMGFGIRLLDAATGEIEATKTF